MTRSAPLPAILALGLLAGTAARAETEVVVQGNRLERRSPRDPTAHSTVFRRQELTMPGASAATIVSRSPGAQVQRTGAASEAATLSLRGGPSSQLPVYLGSIALNDEVTGAADLSLMPLFFIERVEVYRGHAPSFADRLGLTGALVIEPRLPRRSEWYGGASVGSYGATTLYTGGGVGNEHSSSLVALQRTTAANDYPYWDNRGTVKNPLDDRRVLRQNADAETLELWATGQYRPTSTTRLRWLVHGLEREQGVTGLSIIPAHHARARTTRELGALTATLACRANRSPDDCNIELQSQWQRTTFGFDNPFLELGYRVSHVDSSSTRASERLRLNHRVLRQWSLGWLLGADVGALDWLNRGDVALGAQRRSGLFGINSSVAATPELIIVALGRLPIDNTIAEGVGRWQNLPSGRLGASYALTSNLSLLANVGSYGRVPTLAELYGISANVRGNPQLRAERGLSEDFGLRWRWFQGSLGGNAEAVVYHQRTSDLVAWQRTSFAQVAPYNIGRARLVGAEFSSSIAWAQSLALEGVASLLDPRDVTPNRVYANDILPYRSRFTGHVRFDARLPQKAALPGIRDAGIGATLLYRSSRYSAQAGNAVLPSSTSLDLDARFVLRPIPLTVRGAIMNLLDRQNYDLLGLPLPGRSYFVGAEVNLQVEP